MGETVKISYVDQNREGIDPDKNLWEVVSGRQRLHDGGRRRKSPAAPTWRASASRAPTSRSRAGVLSGGERNRLNLALTLKQGGNLLLLDEPTNDLDAETLASLEEALLAFPGCAVVIKPRPLVPRPRGHAHPGLGGHRREPRHLVRGSRATSRRTRRIVWSVLARRLPVRTASIASSRVIKRQQPRFRHKKAGLPVGEEGVADRAAPSYAFSTRTAQTLYSGAFDTRSSAALVSQLLLASWK